MFKNKALFVQMVPSPYTTEQPTEFLNPEWIDKAIKEQVNHVALVIVGVMVLGKILDTTAAVIVRRTPSKR